MARFLLLLMVALALPVSAGNFDDAAYKTPSLADVAGELEVDHRVACWYGAAHPSYHTVAVSTGDIREDSVPVLAISEFSAVA